MKSLHQKLLAAALLAAFGAGAIAQAPTPAPAPGAPRTEMQHRSPMDPARAQEHRARMEQRIAKRMADFKQMLRITPAQEGAWSAWTTAMRPAARPQRGERAEWERLTTPERIDRMRTLRAARAADMDRRGDATKAFYATLDVEQKKTFDNVGLRFMQGGKRGHHRGHHRG
jgi:periplasmic protein CpxP/Spy